MAISTANTTLAYSTDSGTSYSKLVDIINYPDFGSTPTKIDTTDLSQTDYTTNILGLQEIPDLTFECNYDKDVYDTIDALDGEQYLQLQFGTAGAEGLFTWQGEVKVFIMGGGVNEARKMQVTCGASTTIVKS